MAIKLAVLGECMIELSEKGSDIQRHFGGDTLNTAVYLARVNADLSVHYVTALGQDVFSHQMLAHWQAEGIKTDMVQQLDDKLPGLYFIETDALGERTFHYWRNDAAARYWLRGPDAERVGCALCGFDYLYLSGITLAVLPAEDRARLFGLLAQCRAQGVKIAFDNNYRPRLWQNPDQAREAYSEMLAMTDLAFLTLDDEFSLWGDDNEAQCIARTQGLGVAEIVIKRGAKSCLVLQAGEQYQIPACRLSPEQVVDTTAAGDSFSAGYLAVRLAGGGVEASASFAHRLAGTVIQHRGAVIAPTLMPTFPSDFIERNHVTIG